MKFKIAALLLIVSLAACGPRYERKKIDGVDCITGRLGQLITCDHGWPDD